MGRSQMPLRQRRWLRQQAERLPLADQPLRLFNAPVQPFLDLLNRPAGGAAYCGGPLLLDPQRHWPLHHYRGDTAIDCPLAEWADWEQQPERVEARLFWCGPLAFHFGHQIADFGSRVLRSSLDPRGGELLWIPWRTPAQWPALKEWQQQLLTYLNPGHKRLRLATAPLIARELIVWPQQARMRAVPTAFHLEALSWCERTIPKGSQSGVVYVSRNRFAPCTSSDTLIGAFGGERRLEELLQERGVRVVYPEILSLLDQLKIYRDAQILIVAEGSAQHGLELLGVHLHKQVILLCRRPQRKGMDLPLKARFPKLQVVEAVTRLWVEKDGVAWNGLAELDWGHVASVLNQVLDEPLSGSDLQELTQASTQQLKQLKSAVALEQRTRP
tara:strand:- start:196 stop:1353 length:1158 start_codon:yes stop_codon:yes gene_type:complete